MHVIAPSVLVKFMELYILSLSYHIYHCFSLLYYTGWLNIVERIRLKVHTSTVSHQTVLLLSIVILMALIVAPEPYQTRSEPCSQCAHDFSVASGVQALEFTQFLEREEEEYSLRVNLAVDHVHRSSQCFGKVSGTAKKFLIFITIVTILLYQRPDGGKSLNALA